MPDSQVRRLGLGERKYVGGVGKHTATNDGHLRRVIARLDAAGDAEAADTIAWLVWHHELVSVRMYEAFENLHRLENDLPKAG